MTSQVFSGDQSRVLIDRAARDERIRWNALTRVRLLGSAHTHPRFREDRPLPSRGDLANWIGNAEDLGAPYVGLI